MHPPSTALFEKIFLLNNRLRGGTKFKFPRHVYSIRRTILVCCRLRVRDQRSKTKKIKKKSKDFLINQSY